ncbi:DNA repair protein RAD5, putative [Plasmodium relictum]|uniref:DNA repair protein RAD5, putative n=1 Tax=Plasmodium relictum TaxID=85471 RepID=A0A1J1H9K2_PLARL|nr:DNA repair protein RAD5, putative [Plasmodium relictum]CRH01658.1 DNA repair protein RAD5, putative [Plasmodium relictum]
MTSSNYFKNETKINKKSFNSTKYDYDSDVIEIINLNDNESNHITINDSGSLEKSVGGNLTYNILQETSDDIEIIEDINNYNNEKLKLEKIKEFELSKKKAEFIRDKGVFFEYYLGCIEAESIILSSEVSEIKNDNDIKISYEISPKATKRSYSPMYTLKVNDDYVISNDYVKIIGRNIPTNTNNAKKKKTTVKKRNSTSYNEDYNESHYEAQKIISVDKKYVEFEKNKSEVLKDIYEGYSCIRIRHNNRDVSKLKSDLSKTLSVLLVLNAIRIEIKLARVQLTDIKFGGSLKTFIHVILYPDSFKIDSHKFHEYNSLIKYSVNNLFKELKITPLRLAKIDDINSLENSNFKINKDDLLLSSNNILKSSNINYKKDKNLNTSGANSSGFCTPHKALGFNPRKTDSDLTNIISTKEEEDIIDTLSENEREEDEQATNLVFVEEKYRGGYLLEDFEEIYPNDFYFKPKLKTYQAEGIWWMYTRENPPEYSKKKDKQINIKEIIIDENSKRPNLSDNIIKNEGYVKMEIGDKILKNTLKSSRNESIYNLSDYKNEDVYNLNDHKNENYDNINNCKKEKLEKINDFVNIEYADDDIRNKEPLNPLWEEHAFIPNIKIYEKEEIVCVLKYFYINKSTGAFSLTYPQYVPPFRGGILADEMGLGKTIQSIGLITHDIYCNNLHLKESNMKNKNNFIYIIENTIRGFNFKNGGTLVVAPLALLYQWKQEIERHTKEGFISSYIYYGNSKDISSEELSKYSVVLTTYSTLVSEYKNTLSKRYDFKECDTTKSKSNDKKKLKDSLNKVGTKKLNNFFMKTVLGSCNSSSDNIAKSNEEKTNKLRNNIKECSLYKITWRRIFIDEAHVIKNKNSIQSIAVWKLRGERKWCLTGTPIQNSIFDIFPLFRFLGIKPYGTIEWWNKEILDYVNKNRLHLALDVVRKISSPILLRRTKKSKAKDGNYIITLPKKNIHLEKLEFSLEEEDFYRAIFYRSKTKFDTYMHDGNVLSHYSHVLQLLLRLRQCCSHPLLLFSKPFFEEWNREDMNNALKHKNDSPLMEKKNGNSFFNGNYNDDKDSENGLDGNKEENNIIYNFILGATKSKKLDDDYANELEILKNGNAVQCAICLEDAIFPLISKCLHIMCKKCADDYFHLTQIADKKCPQCDNYINLKSLKTLQENKSPLDELLKKMKKENFVYSTKLKKLFEHIQNDMKNELHIVVFSQWIGFLKIIQKLLMLHNIPNKIYDGSLTYEERKSVLHWFNIQKGNIYHPGIGFVKPSHTIPMEDIAGKVLLCSLKAGGVGLNLTVSSKVYLMDMWWNPAVEDQAFERVHRIGQLKDVDIYKFVLKKTVEERILQIHQSKQYTANQILAQEGNKINTEMNLAPQKLGMDDFILMFKDWNSEE